MAGIIEISPGNRWSAAGWLFDWTLRVLAERVGDEHLRQAVGEVVDENLGRLSLDDYGEAARAALVAAIEHDLLPAAQAELPATIPDRPATLDLVRALVEQVRQP